MAGYSAKPCNPCPPTFLSPMSPAGHMVVLKLTGSLNRCLPSRNLAISIGIYRNMRVDSFFPFYPSPLHGRAGAAHEFQLPGLPWTFSKKKSFQLAALFCIAPVFIMCSAQIMTLDGVALK